RWYNRKAEITIYIIPTHQGKGIGKQALAGIMRYAFHSLNFYRLEAEVIEFNHRGIQLFQKFGFVEEGRLRSAKFYNGKYYDVIRFGLLRDEFESSSNQIINP
ncbi:MAG: N-acetyltransferase, partial [Methanobacteriota archaeon]